MTVKLILLKSGENIISDVKEGFYEEKLVCYILDKPCSVTLNGTYKILDDNEEEEESTTKYSISLQPWPVLSKDTTIELIPDWIVTIVEPNDNLRKIYETQVLGKEENETNQTIVLSQQSDSDQSN